MTAHLLTLPGGERFMVRPIEANDKPGISDFFARLSEESRRRRFLGPKPRLSSRDLAFLTEVDQRRHVAIVALDGAGAIVGVARYAAWVAEPERADMAVAVVDEWHGHGLGTALGDLLVEQARASGLAALTGSTLAFNSPAKALLKRLGFRPKGISSGVADYELVAPSQRAESATRSSTRRSRARLRAEVRGEVLLDPALVDRPHLAQQRDALVGERDLQRAPVLRVGLAPHHARRARRGRRSGSSRSGDSTTSRASSLTRRRRSGCAVERPQQVVPAEVGQPGRGQVAPDPARHVRVRVEERAPGVEGLVLHRPSEVRIAALALDAYACIIRCTCTISPPEELTMRSTRTRSS